MRHRPIAHEGAAPPEGGAGLPPFAWLSDLEGLSQAANWEALREVLLNLPVPFYATDAEGRIQLFNAAAAALWGRSPVVGRDRWSGAARLLHPDGSEMPARDHPMAAVLATGQSCDDVELLFERPNGERRQVVCHLRPLRDVDGRMVGGVGAAIDVTEQRQADEARARLAAIVECSDDAIVSKDLNGIIQSWNRGAERLFGYTAAEAIGRPVTMLIPEDRAGEEEEIRRRIGRGERVEHYDTTRRTKDGRLVEVSITVSPLRDRSGRVIGASKIARDISERRRADDTALRLAAIVESSDDAIVSKDLNGIIRSWNAAATRLFGYTPEEAIGRSIMLLIPPERRAEEDMILERIRSGARVEHYSTMRRRKDGGLVEVSLTISPVRDASGRIIGASKIARDVTERNRAQRELQVAHARALAAVQAKDDFLAALSHELRTPLNPVLLLASSAAEDPALSADIRRDFASIRKHVELEARLIDDLLDLTRITRGKLPLTPGVHDLNLVLDDALTTVRPDIAEKGLQLTCELDPWPAQVRADAVRLQQVFWNVLKNAVKFTPAGGRISVRTRVDGSRRRVTIEVADTGIGITEAELGRVFEAFAQGDHAAGGGSHRFGGVGLGLAISRMLVELQGGTIRAESGGRDQGALFVIELPLATATAVAATAAKPGRGAGPPKRTLPRRRVLLVEDHGATRSALARILGRRNFEVVTAGSAGEARDVAHAGRFDLLISDIGLPDGSGYELMEELNAGGALPGIALTGYGMEEDMARSRRSGFQAHLTKPVAVEDLDRALAQVLDATGL